MKNLSVCTPNMILRNLGSLESNVSISDVWATNRIAFSVDVYVRSLKSSGVIFAYLKTVKTHIPKM